MAFADVDNDGYVDIYVGGAGGEDGVEFNRIVGTGEFYLNNGDLTFKDITDETGTAGTYTWSVRFCDYDDDGDADLFTANDQGIALVGEWSPIRIHRNDGNLRFTDVTREAGLGITGSWMGLAFGDYDLDGDFRPFRDKRRRLLRGQEGSPGIRPARILPQRPGSYSPTLPK